MSDWHPLIDERAFILDEIGALPRLQRDVVLCLATDEQTAPGISYRTSINRKVVGVTLSRLKAKGYVLDGGTAQRQGKDYKAYRLRRALQDALSLTQGVEHWLEPLVKQQRAFWFESNQVWGWIWHPTLWLLIQIWFRADGRNPRTAQRAVQQHPATSMAGAYAQESFGFRLEHQGGPLHEWARDVGLEWV